MNDRERLKQIHGQTESHLTDIDDNFKIHHDVLYDFQQLQRDAKEEGIDLQIVSAFRSFEQQKQIWNKKALGERVLLDSLGQELNFHSLSPEEIVDTILRWSALPGYSRHHWGTDLDVYDKNAIRTMEYNVQLIPEEYEEGGIFHKLTLFLNDRIDNNNSHNFFRPYQNDNGGVAPELWHLSHYPVAQLLSQNLSQEEFDNFIQTELGDLELKDILDKKSEEIFERYITNVNLPQWP